MPAMQRHRGGGTTGASKSRCSERWYASACAQLSEWSLDPKMTHRKDAEPAEIHRCFFRLLKPDTLLPLRSPRLSGEICSH